MGIFMSKNKCLDEDFDKIKFDKKIETKIDYKGRTFKVGCLPNGDKIINRDFSTKDGRPTLEYQKKENSKFYKIRYGERK